MLEQVKQIPASHTGATSGTEIELDENVNSIRQVMISNVHQDPCPLLVLLSLEHQGILFSVLLFARFYSLVVLICFNFVFLM